MRKLKLQTQMSIDGYIAGPEGEMDWMVWNWDEELKNYVKEFSLPIDCILLGRKIAHGFIDHWAALGKEESANDFFTQKMNDSAKVIFSKTMKSADRENTLVAGGNLSEEVNKLKNQPGKDIVVYGGAGIVSSLIEKDLIDEYHLFINPTAIGKGMPIFSGKTNLKLVKSTAFECGIVVLQYEPVK